MYREQGNVIRERGGQPEVDGDGNLVTPSGKVIEYWDKNHFPLGWDKFSVEAFAEAEKVANKVWVETQNEEESIKAGVDAVRKDSEEGKYKLFV